MKEVTDLRGFVLAVGSRGIHALQVVSRDGTLSDWVGCPEESPITKRLAHLNSVAGLEVSFDVEGYKIVSLGLLGKDSPPGIVPSRQDSSLAEAALWYPTVPGSELFLNEASFTGENPSRTGYQPLFWIHFGGPGGSYLRNLTAVSVYSAKGLYSLGFHYDTTHDLAKALKLGRCPAIDISKIQYFPIDGASGEIIDSVEVILLRHDTGNAYNFLKHGKLNSVKMSLIISLKRAISSPWLVSLSSYSHNTLKITTNRQRSFDAGASSNNDAILRPVVIAPGTTLTGFYASQYVEFGLIS